MTNPGGDRLQAVLEAQRQGNTLLAYDLAQKALEAGEGDREQLRYQSLLSLARSGAPEEAQRLYEEWELGASRDEDVRALPARLQKDLFWGGDDGERLQHAQGAAAGYEDVYRETKGYYPGINAATMWLMAGDEDRSRSLARDVLSRIEGEAPKGEEYYIAATRAEAALLLDDLEGAKQSIGVAAGLEGVGASDRNTTWQQLQEICDAKRIDTDILGPLAPATVAFFSGHLVDRPGRPSRFPAAREAAVRALVDDAIRERGIGFGFGALACGADIVCAEAILDAGGELQVVLPFAEEDFVAVSVAIGGEEWVQRFRRCLDRAASVTFATEESHLGDDVLFAFGSHVAMGQAVLRARQFGAEVIHLALWDGHRDTTKVGTYQNLVYWAGLGLENHVIVTVADEKAEVIETETLTLPEEEEQKREQKAGRSLKALLFADVRGFSKLSEAQLPTYWDVVMKGFAHVLSEFDELLYRNTWGDALYLVLDDLSSAARCALALQDFMRETDFSAVGLPADFSMRIGGHYGPVFGGEDPVVGRWNFYGSQVSRTARIEPVTPPGQVYVTEAFAAALATEAPGEFSCIYVGQVPSAKGYGAFRMYRLSRPT